jgi:hypothetical protein
MKKKVIHKNLVKRISVRVLIKKKKNISKGTTQFWLVQFHVI